MSNVKQKQPSTATRASSISAKLANMAATASASKEDLPTDGGSINPVTKNDLEALLSKQRESFKADMAVLMQESTESLKVAVDSLGLQVAQFNSRLSKTEAVVGDNFTKLTEMETAVESLQSQTATLLERVDDLENRSRRSNLRVINVPEGSERGQNPAKFMSDLLMEVTGPGVLNAPPEIERAHRSLGPRPGDDNARKPRAFIVKFLRFQEKEAVLRWARQNKLDYGGTELRVYPDISTALAKKRAAFNPVKSALYQKGIKFRLLHPARLQVSYKNEEHYFDSPRSAQDFYDRRVASTG